MRAISAEDRMIWLRLAQRWLALVKRKQATSEAEEFEDAAQRMGTHPDISQEEQ